MNGAESLLRTAAAAGVNVCFANPGTTEMPMVLALDAVPEIRPVLCLFEGVCTGAADGYGRMAGKPALTLLHLGPGFANGIAYLHDARRARSPIVNLIGEHATWHIAADAPLNSDIESLARPVSAWLRRNTSSQTLARDTAEAIAAANISPGQIATLIIPHDCQIEDSAGAIEPIAPATPPAATADAIRLAAELLRTAARPALFLGGLALTARSLAAAARIRSSTDCRLICETFPKRLERGSGLPVVERLPYFPEPAMSMLASHDAIVLAGAREPVSFFGYPGLPSYFIQAETAKHTLAGPEENVEAALEALADEICKPDDVQRPDDAKRPERPSGAITLESFGAAIASVQSENAIVMDEGNTSSFYYFGLAAGAPRFTHLAQPGGAIGLGMPVATGAAVAAPDRTVINLQADGSAMYTIQALWTQAREELKIKTVLCNNGGYRVLGVEMQRAGVREFSPRLQSLIGLVEPKPDWVKLANGMGVPAERVERAEDLAAALERSLDEPGPYFIEAVFS